MELPVHVYIHVVISELSFRLGRAKPGGCNTRNCDFGLNIGLPKKALILFFFFFLTYLNHNPSLDVFFFSIFNKCHHWYIKDQLNTSHVEDRCVSCVIWSQKNETNPLEQKHTHHPRTNATCERIGVYNSLPKQHDMKTKQTILRSLGPRGA